MTYIEAVEFLYSLRFFGAKLGLENTLHLAELCENPHRSLRFIHVAGTNGKGSVCAILESIYRAAGLKTGLFTSPHLISFTERIQVNRRPISEDEVVCLTSRMLQIISRANGGRPREDWTFRPTFFEVVTVMALLCFQREQCDLVIWETGLGGRLDATNIVTPLVSVITNVQADHQQWLGTTIPEIAAEKAGIIKEGVPVVTAAHHPGALTVLAETSKNRHASFHRADPRDYSESLASLDISMPGEHQKWNAACALEAVRLLQPLITVPLEAISRGLREVRWPGRLQLVRRGNRAVLLDGAHNPDGVQALAATLKERFCGQEITLVAGFFQDKDWRRMCDILFPLARRVILVPIQSERSLPPADVVEHCRRMHYLAEVVACNSVAEALEKTRSDKLVVVAGSLHLVGEALEDLKVEQHGPSERALNDWTSTAGDNSGRSAL